MTDAITHRGFFGDKEHPFALTDPMVAELERLTGKGIVALYLAVASSQMNLCDLVEIIRLGLIGGGMDPQDALRLVETYARNRPLDQIFPLAFEIIDARYSGKAEATA